MRKYICVNKETMAKLRKIFGIAGEPLCERTVKNALAFRSDSKLAKKIRYTAKQNGGVTYHVCEDMECWFDSDGSMWCVFPNDAELWFDKTTGEVTMYFKGKVVKRLPAILTSRIQELQDEAAALR